MNKTFSHAGVFFDNRIEHIKFVDFCGKYRVPLLQYLCSSKYVTTTVTLDSNFIYFVSRAGASSQLENPKSHNRV